MQKLRYFPPEPNPRSVSPQPLRTVLVPGKRKPFIKETLPPVPPRIDNRVWHSTSQVISAIAENRLHPSFANQALAEVRAYELHFGKSANPLVGNVLPHDALNGELSRGYHRAKAKATPDLASRAIYLRRKLARR